MKILKDPFEKYGEYVSPKNSDGEYAHFDDDPPTYKKAKKALLVRRLFILVIVLVGIGCLFTLATLVPTAILLEVLRTLGAIGGIALGVFTVIYGIEYNLRQGQVLKNAKKYGILDQKGD